MAYWAKKQKPHLSNRSWSLFNLWKRIVCFMCSTTLARSLNNFCHIEKLYEELALFRFTNKRFVFTSQIFSLFLSYRVYSPSCPDPTFFPYWVDGRSNKINFRQWWFQPQYVIVVNLMSNFYIIGELVVIVDLYDCCFCPKETILVFYVISTFLPFTNVSFDINQFHPNDLFISLVVNPQLQIYELPLVGHGWY